MNKTPKRWLSALVVCILLLDNLPISVFAQESDGLCEHHAEHTAECGYTEENPEFVCTYVCEECQTEADGGPAPTEYPGDSAWAGIATYVRRSTQSPEDGFYAIRASNRKLQDGKIPDKVYRLTFSSVGTSCITSEGKNASQVFYLCNLGNGYFALFNFSLSTAMTANENFEQSSLMTLQPFTNCPQQQWRIVSATEPDGPYNIVSSQKDMYLDVHDALHQEGNAVKLYPQNYQYSAQDWFFDPVSGYSTENHSHILRQIDAVSPTCTEKGVKTHYRCYICHQNFEDAAGTNLLNDISIPATGHTEVTDEAVEATCTKTGLTEGSHCSVCGAVLVAQNKVGTKPHDYADATCTVPKTCKVCSATDGNALGHSFTNYVSNNNATCTADGTKTAKCDRCDATDTITDTGSAKGHTEVIDAAKDATCTDTGLTEGKHCSVCKVVLIAQTEVSAKGHTYEAPTYLWAEDGSVCTAVKRCHCGHEVSESASINSTVKTEPTCTEKGVTTYTATFTGGNGFTTQTLELTNINALGHRYGTTVYEWAEDGSMCTAEKLCHCGHRVSENASISSTVKTEPTCTEKGVTTYTATFTGGNDFTAQTLELTNINALGHRYGTAVYEWAEDGSKCTAVKRCHCGHEVSESASISSTVKTEPTCTEKGVTTYTATFTGGNDFTAQTRELTDISALGHSYGEWSVSVPATPEADGVEVRQCSRCSGKDTRPLPYMGNHLVIDDSELKNQSVVWIDGIAYPVDTDDNGTSSVSIPDYAPPVLVTYSYNSRSDDPHTQYPTGMRVYRIHQTAAGATVEYLPELDNILQYSGSSIRITGNKGIRMITSVNQDMRNALTGNGLADYKLLEYGTLLAQTSKLESRPLTLDNTDVDANGKKIVCSNYAYSKESGTDSIFQYKDGLIQYTNVLVGFTDDQCAEDIAMRPYMKLMDKDGKVFVIYGGIVYRSIGYIAYQNRNAFAPGSAAHAYVWSIIHKVYGDPFDSEGFSPSPDAA